jgi:hypothetical protein
MNSFITAKLSSRTGSINHPKKATISSKNDSSSRAKRFLGRDTEKKAKESEKTQRTRETYVNNPSFIQKDTFIGGENNQNESEVNMNEFDIIEYEQKLYQKHFKANFIMNLAVLITGIYVIAYGWWIQIQYEKPDD